MSSNVTSVEPARRINPELAGSLDRVDPETAAQPGAPVRRLTRLDADYYAALDRMPTRSVPAPRREITVEVPDRAWLRVLERVVGEWAPTLRASLALAALFLVATVLMVVALGLPGLLLSGGIAVIGGWLNAAGRLPRA
jgi:hypothetical protein